MAELLNGPGTDGVDPIEKMDFFLYGTLCYTPLLMLVLGRELPADSLVPDTLPGHKIHWAKDQIFPLVQAADGAMALGLRVSGLTSEDFARLSFYEGGFHFDIRPVTLSSGATVQMFFPREGNWLPGDAWDLRAWSEAYGALTLAAAEEVMSYYGERDAAEVAGMFTMIRNRAWSRLLSADDAVPNLRSALSVNDLDIIDKTRVYVDFFALDEVNLRFTRFDGTFSRPVKRAIFIGAEVVMVLPYDAKRDRVLIVEQFRAGPYLRGAYHPWMLEPVAGIIDAGETPMVSAMRETLEETGIVLQGLEPVAKYYPSPGATNEFYHSFIGLADLPDAAAGVSGLESEAEDIRSHIMGFDAFMELLDGGEVETGPLLLCGYWLARNRDRLRAGA